MTSKEYLNRAYRLYRSLNSKLEQLESLKALAEKCTPVLSDMPKNPSSNTSSMEDTIASIIDLQNDLCTEIQEYVDTIREIREVLNQVTDSKFYLILHKRYLNYKHWEEIAVDMNYSYRYLLTKHGQALKEVDRIIGNQKTQH